MLAIIPYKEDYLKEYQTLCRAWLEEYNLVEQGDKTLEDPKSEIVDKGGHIFMASYQNEIVGTVSLQDLGNEAFEIGKMGVATKHHRLGIGRKLMNHSIEVAKLSGKKKIILETHSKLRAAISLYQKVGFVITHVPKFKHELSDVYMELRLS